MKILLRMLMSGLSGSVLLGLLIFVPAGTLNYWQGWMFIAVLGVSGWVFSLYFLRKDPEVLERRMLAPESRATQRVFLVGVSALWVAQLVVSVLDHRFGWSRVPAAISVAGSALLVIGLILVALVIVQNSHAAVTVRVEEGQQLISTGLYGLVRHPMYTCNAFLYTGTALALGSYWGVLFVIPTLLMFIMRIHDEEKMLREELDGYSEYMQKVPYRLVPHVW